MGSSIWFTQQTQKGTLAKPQLQVHGEGDQENLGPIWVFEDETHGIQLRRDKKILIVHHTIIIWNLT